jgi:hypothetical protein
METIERLTEPPLVPDGATPMYYLRNAAGESVAVYHWILVADDGGSYSEMVGNSVVKAGELEEPGGAHCVAYCYGASFVARSIDGETYRLGAS